MDPVIASIISALLGAAIPLILYLRKNKAEVGLTEMQRIKVLLDEVQEERDKARNYVKELEVKVDELKGVIKKYNGSIAEYQSERQLLISGIADLKKENTHILEDRTARMIAWDRKEKALMAANNGLRDEVEALRKQINGVEKTAEIAVKRTDELKKETQQLKKQTGNLLS